MKTKLSHRHKTVRKFLKKVASSLNDFNHERKSRDLEPLPIAQIMAPLYLYFDEFNLDIRYEFIRDLEASPDYQITLERYESLAFDCNMYKFRMIVDMRRYVNKNTNYYTNPVGHNYIFYFVSNMAFIPCDTMKEGKWRFSIEKTEMVYLGDFWKDDSYTEINNNTMNYDEFIEEFEKEMGNDE